MKLYNTDNMLSVAVIAREAAQLLPKCLASVKSVADDIVVAVDPRTTDETAQIARKYGARVFCRDFDNFAAQKNYAASKCKHNWVLSLDADEELSPELIFELKSVDFRLSAYKIPRLNIIFGKAILHSNWEPSADTHLWLYDRTRGQWANPVHEEVVTTGRVGQLQGNKIHHSYRSVEEFMDKMNVYTSLETKAQNPFLDFLRRYVWHKGFLDGWRGLFLSYLMFIYHIVVWVKKNFSSS